MRKYRAVDVAIYDDVVKAKIKRGEIDRHSLIDFDDIQGEAKAVFAASFDSRKGQQKVRRLCSI